jgi:Xaa-Pro aminopeptidase
MRFDVAGKALDACRGFAEVEDASLALAAITRAKRPREIALLRLAYRCLHAALGEVERVRGHGGDDRAALLAGERSARMAGAQDVRTLCSVDGTGALRPVGSPSARTSSSPSRTRPAEPWTVYFALRRGGYWAEAMVTLTGAPPAAERAARRALDAAATSMRAGIACRDLFRRIQADRGSHAGHPFLGTGICRASGLSLDGEPWMQADSDEALVENGVYTIATGAGDGGTGHFLLSTTVLAKAAGCEILWPVTAGAEAR